MAFDLKNVPEDLDDISLPTLRASAKFTASATPTAAPAKSFGVSWGDRNIAVVGDGLDRLKCDVGKKLRFAIIPGFEPQGAKTHFIAAGDKKGLFRCPGEGCPRCAAGDEARWTIAALAVAYTNADAETGKLATDAVPAYKVGYLSLSQSNFKSISEAPEEGKSPLDVDLAMSFDGRRYGFNVISSTPRYVAVGDTEKIVALAKEQAHKLLNKIGRPITNDALRAMRPLSAGATFADMET